MTKRGYGWTVSGFEPSGRLPESEAEYAAFDQIGDKESNMTIIELQHPSDPRFLMLPDGMEPPAEISIDEIAVRKYGQLLIIAPGDVDYLYQSVGVGRWVKPDAVPAA